MKKLYPQDIVSLHSNHCVKDEEYYKKYEEVPYHLMSKWDWDGKDYARVPCVLDFKEWVEKYGLKEPNHLLYTDDVDPELEYLSPKNKTLALYNFQNNSNDLHLLDLENKDFDFILFSQTFEHLYNPYLALENIVKHLRPGGCLFTSVPTKSIPHMVPFYFWTMSKMGLCALLHSFNLEILEVGEWGNYDYVANMEASLSWPDHRQLIKDGKILNDPNRPCQTWVLARKPL